MIILYILIQIWLFYHQNALKIISKNAENIKVRNGVRKSLLMNVSVETPIKTLESQIDIIMSALKIISNNAENIKVREGIKNAIKMDI